MWPGEMVDRVSVPLTGCVVLDELLILFAAQCWHLPSRGDDNSSLTALLGG